MKKLTVALLLICFAAGTTVFGASKDSHTRKVTKSFAVKGNTLAVLENKHSNLVITEWDKQEVYFDIEVTVRTNNNTAQQKAEDLVIDLNQSSGTIKAKTDFGINNTGREKVEVHTTYKVFLPKNVDLDINNKFGNIRMSDFGGNLKCKEQFGNIEAGVLSSSKKHNISVGFGNLNIESIKDLKADVSHGNTRINSAGDVSIVQKFGNINIKKANDVSFSNSHGNTSLGVVNSVSGSTSFGNLSVSDVATKVDVKEVKHGNATIALVRSGFNSVKLSTSFGNASVTLQNGAPYDFELYNSFGNINIRPETRFVTKQDGINTKDYKGFVVQEGSGSMLKISTKHGNIKIGTN